MRGSLTAMLMAAGLSACAVGPRYAGPPAVPAAAEWTEPAQTAEVDLYWWRGFHDPVLEELVRAGLERNLDLRIAAAQLREARANRAAAFGGRFPELDATGSASRNEISQNGEFPIRNIPGFPRRFNLFDVGFDASWEIDFWGRLARGVDAADARADAALESLRSARLEVVAEVVRAYVDLCNAQARLASTQADAEARRRTAILVEERYRAGEASRFDFARAESQARSTESEIPELRANERAASYTLAVLTGQPPEKLVQLADQPHPLPSPPSLVAVGLRSDLLRRRPDVREAERELAAAKADVAVATADLFPRVNLIATVGQQARNTGDLGASASTRYQLGPSFSWPVFAAGRIRAQIRATDARSEQAAARYEKAVLTALSDSETALNRYAAARAGRVDRDAALEQSAQAVAMARERYQAGEEDLINLLESESEFRVAEEAALNARAGELTALVTLYKALGGGWQS
jgi:NodT family efflux transporter outer membrane factor (OMF) lipoprotein